MEKEKTSKQARHEQRNDKAQLLARMQKNKTPPAKQTSTFDYKKNVVAHNEQVLKQVQKILTITFACVGVVFGLLTHPMQYFFFPGLSIFAKIFMDGVVGIGVFAWLMNYYKNHRNQFNDVISGMIVEKVDKQNEKRPKN